MYFLKLGACQLRSRLRSWHSQVLSILGTGMNACLCKEKVLVIEQKQLKMVN
jgi:hexokinase